MMFGLFPLVLLTALGLLPQESCAFTPHGQLFISFHELRRQQSQLGASFPPNQDYGSGDTSTRTFPIKLIASAKILLPGETTTLYLKDQESIAVLEDCLEHESGLLAVGVSLEDVQDVDPQHNDHSNTEDDDMALAEICSLCEVKRFRFTVTDSGMEFCIDAQSVGRVRVHRMIKQYSSECFQFESEILRECLSSEERRKARLIKENIILLIKTISEKENKLKRLQQQGLNTDNQIPVSTVQELFEESLQRVIKATNAHWHQEYFRLHSEEHDSSEDIHSLIGTSWAVFLSLNDPMLEERYRLRALDWDNLLERLKLAQYALREKDLLLQGQLLMMSRNANESVGGNVLMGATDDELEAFQ